MKARVYQVRSCAVCEQEFVPVGVRALVCGKVCKGAKRRARYASDQDHAEALRERARLGERARKASDPAYAEHRRNYARLRRIADPGHMRELDAAAYRRKCERDPVAMRMQGRKKQQTRRARMREAFVEYVDPMVLFERDRGICGICREPVDRMDWHLDHVVPLALGGEHRYGNVQVSHPFCNRSKGGRAA